MNGIAKKIAGWSMVGCIAVLGLTHVRCVRDTLFDARGKAWNAPRAFVTIPDISDTITLNDTAALHLTDSISVEQNVDFACIGFATNLKSGLHLKGIWDFNEGYLDTEDLDSSFILRHTFSDTGLHKAIFTIDDQMGNSASDTVKILVVKPIRPRTVSIDLLSPGNNTLHIDPAQQDGVLFLWQINRSDPQDTLTSDIYIVTDTLSTVPTVAGTMAVTVNIKSLKYGTKYYWYVKVKRNSDSVAQSQLFSFMTSSVPPPTGPFIKTISGDMNVTVGDSVHFFAFVGDSGSSITEYAWSFYGDTTFEVRSTVSADCYFIYPSAGVFKAVFRAIDQNDRRVYDTLHISVAAAPPLKGPVIDGIRKDTTVMVNDSMPFFAHAKDSGAKITQYAWDFESNGVYEYVDTSSASCKHAFTNTGIYKSVLRVTDKNNKADSATVTITVIPADTGFKGPVIINIRHDTIITVLDSLTFIDSVKDNYSAITKYYWDYDGNGTFDDSSSTNISFKTAFQNTGSFDAIFKVVDANGKSATATVKVIVQKIKFVVTSVMRDTMVDFGNTVHCSIAIAKAVPNMAFAIDTLQTGSFKLMTKNGLSASYDFKVDTAAISDSVRIRITAPLTDTLVTGFKVNVRPRQLTITGIDSTYSTITIHWTKSIESSFQSYYIYRNSTSTVDTSANGNLLATISQAATTVYTTPVSYTLLPKYYRIYQRDKNGLMSPGSPVVFGNIKNSPPAKPIFVNPTAAGQTILSNSVLSWTKSVDPNGDSVTYQLLYNRNNSGYVSYAKGIVDTFIKLNGFDSLSLTANLKIIARDNYGAGDSSELLNINFQQSRFGRMYFVPKGTGFFTDSLNNIVGITYNYFMDSSEVTQLSYKKMMNGKNPSTFIGDNHPVETMTWYQAIMYCNAYSKSLNLDTAYRFTSIDAQGAGNLTCNLNAKAVRLPIEDEWEKAAQGGKSFLYATSDGMLSCLQANYSGCQIDSPVVSASYRSNPFNLYDMTGNVAEFCWDVFGPRPNGNRVDYANPTSGMSTGNLRVQRGGDYQEIDHGRLQNNSRHGSPANVGNPRIGFRCVIPLKQ